MSIDFWIGLALGIAASWAFTIATGWLLIHAMQRAEHDDHSAFRDLTDQR